MTNTDLTLTEVLSNHFAVGGKTDETIADDARALGLIFACLGCGSVGGINPDAPLGEHASVEAARVATRDHINPRDFECCGDNTTILF